MFWLRTVRHYFNIVSSLYFFSSIHSGHSMINVNEMDSISCYKIRKKKLKTKQKNNICWCRCYGWSKIFFPIFFFCIIFLWTKWKINTIFFFFFFFPLKLLFIKWRYAFKMRSKSCVHRITRHRYEANYK